MWHALSKHLSRDHSSLDAAVAVLEEAVRRVPIGTRGGLFEAWGGLEFRRGNVHLSLRLYTDALRTDPYAPLYVSLAVAQMKLNMIADSRNTFRQGAVVFPSHAPLWRAWAFLESQYGSSTDALEGWRAAVSKDPSNARAWKMLVQVEHRCGAGSAALADLLYEALVSCPNDSVLRMQLARIEERRKGLAIARSILVAVEAQGDIHVLRALGRIEFEQGNWGRGRAYFRRAALVEASGKDRKGKRRPKEPSVKSLHSWALMEAKHGFSEDARDILEEAKSICQNDSGVWRAIAEIESRDHNYEEARKAFQHAVAIDPNDARLFLAWGKTEALAGDVKRAEDLIDHVTKVMQKGAKDSPSSVKRESRDTGFSSDAMSGRQISFQSGVEENRNISLTPHVLAAALRERAMLASRDGRFGDSVRLLTRASQIEPFFEAGWRLLASQELRLQGIEVARQVYKKGMESVEQRSKPKLLHWWGQDERGSGFVDRARELFRKSTCANPDYMSAWMSWGLMEKAEGNVEEACSIFEEATKRAEQDLIRAPFVFQAWGRVEELSCGRVDKAASVFQRGVQLVPNSGQLWSAWGMLENRRGNISQARELFEKATSCDPKYGSAWHSWALLEIERCNFGRASDLFRLGNENEPSNSSLLVSWAAMEGKELGSVARGRDLYERAVTADPLFGPAWHAWGCLEMQAGNVIRARELLLKASKVRSEDGAAWHSLGVLEAEHGRNEEAAIRHWKRALEVSAGHVESYVSWAGLVGRGGDMAGARRLIHGSLAIAKEQNADLGLVLQAWAKLEEQAGNIEKARDLLRRSVAADEKRAESWRALAEIEEGRGLRAEARMLLRQGIEKGGGGTRCAKLFVALGLLEAKDGDLEASRRAVLEGMAVAPNDAEVWRATIDIEEGFGSVERGKEIRERFERVFVKRRWSGGEEGTEVLRLYE